MKKTSSFVILFILLITSLQTSAQSIYRKDFDYYWQQVKENFAYFHTQHTDWDKVKAIYQPVADTVRNARDFIHLLENVNNELYNGHIFLNTNTATSNRLIPSGADIKVSRENGKYTIVEIREGFNADLCGMQAGMIVTAFNHTPIDKAVATYLPKSVSKYDRAMYEYAANMLLAGTHDKVRVVTVMNNGKEQTFHPDSIPNKTESNYTALLEAKRLAGNIGYIRINNSLWNNDLIKAFDATVDSLMNTAGLILDLRETPGGGNTTVARAIMGRFIDKEQPYQKHIYVGEEMETGVKRATLELVSPRNNQYKKPLIVLAGYWTGSMGEGIVIGFDAMKRGTVAGTKMAGLLGEIYTFEMPETKIRFSIPFARLAHVNGQPREEYIPPVVIRNQHDAIKTVTALLLKRSR